MHLLERRFIAGMQNCAILIPKSRISVEENRFLRVKPHHNITSNVEKWLPEKLIGGLWISATCAEGLCRNSGVR